MKIEECYSNKAPTRELVHFVLQGKTMPIKDLKIKSLLHD